MSKMRVVGGGTVEIKMRDLRGRWVRTRRDMQNGYMKLPAGSVVRVNDTWRSGVTLEAPTCAHCGVSTFIAKVHRDDVELVSVSASEEDT